MLVAAPTGRARRSWARFAVFLALNNGVSASTPPLSRLSRTRSTPTWSGATAPPASGLLTGDTSVNPEAPIVVMTTEVLRNMIYAGRPRWPTWAMWCWTRSTIWLTDFGVRSGKK